METIDEASILLESSSDSEGNDSVKYDNDIKTVVETGPRSPRWRGSLPPSSANRWPTAGKKPGLYRSTSFVDDSEAVTLAWSDISVTAPSTVQRKPFFHPSKVTQQKKILRGVSGIVRPGNLLAMMGASGAGKSTLMNVLTFRNRGNLSIGGTVMLNDEPIDKAIPNLMAYVQQDDLFIGTLTIKEHLIFQARLRMDQKKNEKEKMAKVEELIDELGLRKCQNTLIGTPSLGIKSCSGGERKRLSFASELLTNPAIFFCDEPTTGLDSFMAETVINALKHLASRNHTIICTIHQPSSDVYNMFDRILLLAEGRVAYTGPSSEAIRFFSGLGYPCPSDYCPADYFVMKLAIIPGNEVECRKRVEDICDSYDSSNYSGEVQEGITGQEARKLRRRSSIMVKDALRAAQEKDVPLYKASWLVQFRALLWRSWLTILGDPRAVKGRLFTNIVVSVILGLVFLQINTEKLSSIQNIQGVMFVLIAGVSNDGAIASVQRIPLEIPVFLREHDNGVYRTDTYFIAKCIAELPFSVLIPVLYTSIAYWMIGLNHNWQKFLICLGVQILVGNTALSYAYVISAASPDVTVALSVSSVVLVPLMLFCGVFITLSSIPKYFVWIAYISWFRYAYEALCVNQWTDYSIGCIQPNTTNLNTTKTCIDGKDVLKSYGLDQSFFKYDIILLATLLVCFRLLAYIILFGKAYRTKQKTGVKK